MNAVAAPSTPSIATMGSAIQRFAASRPRVCFCADSLPGPILKLPRDLALEFLNVQVGAAPWSAYLVFDVDRTDARNAWRDGGLPPPTFAITNPQNGHAHLLYELAAPVAVSTPSASTRYLALVERAMTARLGADACYVGLLSKNPLHPAWITHCANARYALSELAARFSRSELAARPLRSRGIGRNCDLFDWTRWDAYATVRDHPNEASFAAAVRAYAAEKNASTFDAPLSAKEVGWIAKSVARWTWERRERFRSGPRIVRRGAMGFQALPPVMLASDRLAAVAERRVKAGIASAEARKAATRARIASAVLSLAAEGKRPTAAAVARYTGLSRRTITNHRELLAGDGKVVVLGAGAKKVRNSVYSGVVGVPGSSEPER